MQSFVSLAFDGVLIALVFEYGNLCNTLLYILNNHNYSYTIGIGREDIYLWYESTDNSVQLTDIKWRREDVIGTFINPLLVYNLIYHLQSTSYVTMECVDTTSSYSFIIVGIFFQGLLHLFCRTLYL